MSKFCNQCGGPVSETEKFCQNCGSPVNIAPRNANGGANAYPVGAYQQNNANPYPPRQPQNGAPVYTQNPPRQPQNGYYQNYPQGGINSYPPQPAQNPPFQKTKKSGAGKKILCLILAVIFVAELLVISSGRKPHTGNNPYDDPYLQITDDGHFEGEKTPVGCSRAFSKEVEKGVTVSADENALYKDTELSVTPLTEANDEFLELNEKFRSCGEYILDAWDVDAGLAPDEHLPGEYELKLDLAFLEVPENMYEQAVFYRIDSDGQIYEYATELDGSVVSFRSHQNSLAVLAITTTAVGIVVTKGILKYIAEDYFRSKPGEIPCSTDVGTYSRRCRLMWYASDVDADFAEKTKRMEEIREEVRKETEENLMYESSNILNIFRTNSSIAAAVDKALEENEEYKELQGSLEMPAFIENFKKLIDAAYAYLDTGVGVKMPTYRVDFYLQRGLSDLGQQMSDNFNKSYINIGVNSELLKGPDDAPAEWDNLLLTVTHELFHICQERYHTSYCTDVKSFDEMTAVILESDARDYYTENCYITTKPPLTNESEAFWDTFHFSMDNTNIPGEDKDKNLDPNQEHGYALSRFVMFLRKKTKKQVSVKELMDARSYWFKTDISGPLKYCFDLSDDAFEVYFKAFVLDTNGERSNSSLIRTGMLGSAYYKVPGVTLPKNGSVHVEPSYEGSLSVNAHAVALSEAADCAVLVVPDKDFKEKNPGVYLVPTGSFRRGSKGIFIETQKGTKDLGLIYEICGKEVPSKSQSGYTLYAVPEPAAPVCEVSGDEILFTVPEGCSVYADGCADGYKAVFSFTGCDPVVKDIKASDFGKTVNFGIKDTVPAEMKGSVAFTVKYVPYIKDGAETFLGPESAKTSVGVKIEEETSRSAGGVLTVYDIAGTYSYKGVSSEDNDEDIYGNISFSVSDGEISDLYVNGDFMKHETDSFKATVMNATENYLLLLVEMSAGGESISFNFIFLLDTADNGIKMHMEFEDLKIDGKKVVY